MGRSVSCKYIVNCGHMIVWRTANGCKCGAVAEHPKFNHRTAEGEAANIGA